MTLANWLVNDFLPIALGILVTLGVRRLCDKYYHRIRYKLTGRCCTNPDVMRAYTTEGSQIIDGYVCKNCFYWRHV